MFTGENKSIYLIFRACLVAVKSFEFSASPSLCSVINFRFSAIFDDQHQQFIVSGRAMNILNNRFSEKYIAEGALIAKRPANGILHYVARRGRGRNTELSLRGVGCAVYCFVGLQPH